jgi:cytochrome bd ubiquinol oxidase subunit II
MDLNTLWFILIAILFSGFFFLEGFDYGVGILLPFLGRNDGERRAIIASIGPFWDGNEVWLLTAGGAMFAAFPNWYATLFSGFYLALVLMLLALIVRGVAFEFRNKMVDARWRTTWDWAIFAGSAIPALLWGVAFANIVEGTPIDAHMNYVGTFFGLLNPWALLGGLTTLGAFTLHGAIFLTLKTGNTIAERAHKLAERLWPWVMIVCGVFFFWGYFFNGPLARLGINPGVAPVMGGLALFSVGYFLAMREHVWAFVMTAATIVLATATLFTALFPRVMVSSINPAYSLTIYNASSSPYTLGVMSIIAAIFVPIVLIYQIWNFYIFRQRVGTRVAPVPAVGDQHAG